MRFHPMQDIPRYRPARLRSGTQKSHLEFALPRGKMDFALWALSRNANLSGFILSIFPRIDEAILPQVIKRMQQTFTYFSALPEFRRHSFLGSTALIALRGYV